MRIIAFLLLVISLPISILVALAIFINSPGKIIFSQQRVGLNQQLFTIHKFRTMKHGKIFFVARVVRKLGLDEIPQLFNILKGEMAFVGPRPLTEFDINRLGWTQDEHVDRWKVLPGISGPAQLTNICDANASLRKDLEYVERKSLKFDLQILFRSALVPFIGKHTS